MARIVIVKLGHHRQGGKTDIVIKIDCCKTYLESPAELAAKEYLVIQLHVSKQKS